MALQPQTKTPWALDPAHSSVEFAVKHMVIATVRGRFNTFQVDVDFNEASPERSRVEARIEAASIDTKEQQRDAHLRSADFLDVENHPLIVYTSRAITPLGTDRYHMVGDLTIRGVTRQVPLEVTFNGRAKDPWGAERLGFTLEGSLNRRDFDLQWNIALETGGFLVGDVVKVTINAELVR